MRFIKAVIAFFVYYILISFIIVILGNAINIPILISLLPFVGLVIALYFAIRAYNTNSIFNIKSNLKTDNQANNNKVVRIRDFYFPYERDKYVILFPRKEIAGINYRFS